MTRNAPSRLSPGPGHPRRAHLRRLRRLLERAFDAAVQDARDRTLLDVGCGEMPYRPLFAPRLARYLGVDLPGNPHADLHVEEAGRWPIDDGGVDIVLSCQVLEHVLDPRWHLAEAHRVLRPGGHLILSTHGFWRYHPDPRDLRRWTASGLHLEIESAGFSVQSIDGDIGLGGIALQLAQDAVLPRLPRRLKPLLAAPTQALIAMVNALHDDEARRREALAFVVLARRGEA